MTLQDVGYIDEQKWVNTTNRSSVDLQYVFSIQCDWKSIIILKVEICYIEHSVR